VTNHTLTGEDLEPLKNMSKGTLYDEVEKQADWGTMSNPCRGLVATAIARVCFQSLLQNSNFFKEGIQMLNQSFNVLIFN
jgi:hypothetical protein